MKARNNGSRYSLHAAHLIHGICLVIAWMHSTDSSTTSRRYTPSSPFCRLEISELFVRQESNLLKMSSNENTCITIQGKDGNTFQMPRIGLGTWKSKPGEVQSAVTTAIDNGYKLIDCAHVYGNEAEIGAALKDGFESGKIKREDLFVTSKLWNTRHNPSEVMDSVKESLTNLNLQYLDLYLIHWPMAFKFRSNADNFPRDDSGSVLFDDVDYKETWRCLEQCVDEGLIRAIGLSNFNSKQVQDVMDNCRIKPANLQIEIHPYFSQEKLVAYCQERGVSVTAYSPLGSPDRPWAAPDDPSILEDPRIKALGDKYNKSPAQVILKWLLQRDIAIIPKSVTPSRIKENLEITGFTLTDEDMKLMNSLNRNERMVVPYVYNDGVRSFRDGAAPNFPFMEEF